MRRGGSLVLVLALGCARPTWNRDVQPILEARCASCHDGSGTGGLDLTDEATATANAGAMATRVAAGVMPPWIADPACADYAGDPSLSEDEIAALVGWADAGAPAGRASTGQATETAPEPLDRVDATLRPDGAWTPTEIPIDRRCFLLPYEGGDGYVTGLWVEPAAPSELRSALLWLVAPGDEAAWIALDDADPEAGWACSGGPGGETSTDTAWLGSWTAGQARGTLPEGTGVPVAQGGWVGVQIMVRSADPAPEQPTISLTVEPQVDHPAAWVPVTDPSWSEGGLVIPAGAEDLAFETTRALPEDGTLYAVDLRLRDLGAAASLSGPGDRCLLDIPAWSTNWRWSYTLSTPREVVAGDAATLACRYDNPSDLDVTWGEGGGDEICLGLLYIAQP